jgi:hypothetical protein
MPADRRAFRRVSRAPRAGRNSSQLKAQPAVKTPSVSLLAGCRGPWRQTSKSRPIERDVVEN